MELTNVLTVPGTFTKLATWLVHHGNRITNQDRHKQATHLDGRNDNGCLPECLQGGFFPRSCRTRAIATIVLLVMKAILEQTA